MSDVLNVAVVMGGTGGEREVSLTSGRVVLGSLDPSRYLTKPVVIEADGRWSYATGWLRPGRDAQEALLGTAPVAGRGMSTSDLGRTVSHLVDNRTDLAFLALHGPGGEDGTVQGLFELAGIPYTGSDVRASALAMDKIRTKEVLRHHGIATPDWITVLEPRWREDREGVIRQARLRLGMPLVVKTPRLGSSIGVEILERAEDLAGAIDRAFEFDREVLLEAFHGGLELTCAILGGGRSGAPVALPVTAIAPRGSAYFDTRTKYTAGAAEEITPAPIGDAWTDRVQATAVLVHDVLGLSNFSRVDFKLDHDRLHVLEANSIPGMTPTSLYPQAAAVAGFTFTRLLDRWIELALAERGGTGGEARWSRRACG